MSYTNKRVDIEWFHDCGGKKSCDTTIVRTETRYWPAGGSSFVMRDGRMVKGDDGSNPNGVISIEVAGYGVIEQKFEGETEAEVMAAMERYTMEHVEFIETTLREAYKNRT